MPALLKQSTLVTIRIGPFLDKDDGVTEEVGLGSMGIEISKNHGAFAARNSATATAHDAEGWYSCELNTTDTNTLGPFVVKAHAAATHLPVWREFQVVPANVYDSLVAGSDTLDAAVTEWNGVALGTTNPLPNAAADAAGGLAISDAGGLDLDALNTNVSSILTDTGTSGVLLAATATSAQLVDDVWDEVLTGATHNVSNSSGRRLRQVQESAAVYGGAIWIDTANGTAGTTSYENGTSDNPVDTIADANTLATALGISRFNIASGSTITLAAAQNNQVFDGLNWTLALGGQDITGSAFVGATVSGIAAGTGTTQQFERCIMNACTHRKGTHIIASSIAGTQTVGEAGDYFFDRCHSGIAGTSTWVFEFGDAIGNTNLNVRNYSGGIQLESMGDTGTDTASIEGYGQIIEGTCTGGTVAVRGNFTTSSITNLTLNDDARFDVSQNIGINWADIANPTTAVDLSGTDIQLCDTVTTNTDMLTAAAVNAEVVDVIRTDTLTLPGQEAPTNTPTLDEAITWLYKMMRNKKDQDGSTTQLYDDAGSTVDAKQTTSESGGTVTLAEWVTGP